MQHTWATRFTLSEKTRYSTMQHTATNCNTMKHTAMHCILLNQTATRFPAHWITLQHNLSKCTIRSTIAHDPQKRGFEKNHIKRKNVAPKKISDNQKNISHMPRHYLRRPTTKQYNTMQHSAIDSNKNEIHVTHYLRRPVHCLHVPSVAVCNKPQHTATHCITLQRTATHCSILQHAATHFKHTSAHCKEFDKALIGSDFLQMSVLSKWVVVFCSVLQCAVVCCSVLQCVAVCYSVLQCVAVCCIVLPYVAVCCSVLQCVTVCYSVLQCTVVSPRLVWAGLFFKRRHQTRAYCST